MKKTLYNSEEYFRHPLVEDYGFREYDARWIVEPTSPGTEVQINYRGILQLGYWLGKYLRLTENGEHTDVVVGHDFRKYAENAKNALTLGLVSSGINVLDVGLCMTPMVYFAQYEFSIPACAMITASHNPNGWTGVKMGHDYSRTFGYERMKGFQRFAKEQGQGILSADPAGRYRQAEDLVDRYLAALLREWEPRLSGLPRLRVAVETGNGTGGIVVPELLSRLGFDVVAGHTELDWDFPHFNPNPESLPFLRQVQNLVRQNDAEVGICVDGDGDRLGVIDDRGEIVFSDRVGLLIAKKLRQVQGPSTFVVDVKSTSLFDSELPSCKVVWEKTGHSFIKGAVHREGALAGFERSGHFFFAAPYGQGYDDAALSALILLWLLCEAKAQDRRLSGLLEALPQSHQTPNRQPVVPEENKYQIVESIRRRIEEQVRSTGSFAGVPVENLVTINGIRIQLENGSWLLIRASANTANLVVLGESFDTDGAQLVAFDRAVRELFQEYPDVGDFGPLYEK